MPNQEVPVMIVPDQQMAQLRALVGAIQAHRQANPVQIPYAPGTPTQRRVEHEEDVRRYNLEWPYREGSYRARGGSGGSSGSSSGGGGSLFDPPGTQGERQALATATVLRAALDRYEHNKALGLKYPLYYTINTILRDPEWTQRHMAVGADIQAVIDALIRMKADPEIRTREGYFGSPTGSKLAPIYWDLFGTTDQGAYPSHVGR